MADESGNYLITQINYEENSQKNGQAFMNISLTQPALIVSSQKHNLPKRSINYLTETDSQDTADVYIQQLIEQ